MRHDEIIEMGRQATNNEPIYCRQEFTFSAKQLQAFAKLVAAKEREACAKVCETHGVYPELNVWNGGPDWYKHGKDCATAIRARGKQA
jgi:hypothetical protein